MPLPPHPPTHTSPSYELQFNVHEHCMGAEVLPLYILMKGECRRHHSGSGGALTAWGPVGCAAASTTGAGTGNGAEFGGAGGAAATASGPATRRGGHARIPSMLSMRTSAS